jgi:hypothetical protein
VAHTAGIGSAIFYALGEIYATNVLGHAEKAPVIFADGVQYVNLQNVDLTSDFLAGTIFFSSAERESGAYLLLNESKLTVTADDQPALWWGNIIASADIVASEVEAKSGILVLANRSQVTQDFDYFAGYEQNSAIEAAEVSITVSESNLVGDLVALNQSSISWSLTNYSSWNGTGRVGDGGGTIDITLDATSTWTVTEDVQLGKLISGNANLTNVIGNGFTVSYASNASANAWLGGRQIALKGGGKAVPA